MAESRDMGHPEQIRTERLEGRPISPGDYALLRSIHSDPRAAATLTADGLPPPEARTRTAIDAWTRHWAANGFGVWMFFFRTGDFVGYAGIMHTTVEDKAEVELLYAILPGHWGKGYGTEMSRSAVQFGFERAGLAELVAYTLPTNSASRGVMENCGFRYERDIVHAGLRHVLYRLTAPEYRRNHA